ncbi:hypothetical protein SASPL_111410 [Salvia splendens]|uniref:Uncharacterized protein n=1 Tax=Salvia splendens TaxID=180675 RepID=A0A8X8Y6D8_SALSN|nr:hypothetical protein SASPL_111410 [Salvia splendens]
MDDLKKSCDLFKEPISNFIANKLPHWIFVDFFFLKLLDTAQELDIPVIFYLITTASSVVFCWTPEGNDQRRLPQDMTAPPDWVDFPSQAPKLCGKIRGVVFDRLDKQNPNTVVFGSEYKLKREEIHEISYGIELSGLPFLFLLAKPDPGGDDDEVLPPGFETRTKGSGFVQIGWAPQREILAHPSIGASLFHAGWSSVVENLTHANCLVLLPFIITQPLDTRLLVEKGLAIEVERAEDGSFTRNDIANALQMAMVSKEGEALRARTKEAANGIFANKELNHSYINNFVDYLKHGV